MALKFARKAAAVLFKPFFSNTSFLNKGEKGRAFDAIVIETTGVAQPGPIIQLFFADPQVRKRTTLDAVVTVVDAQHVREHLTVASLTTSFPSGRGQATVGEVVVVGRDEVREQIACADRVVVNKCDLLLQNKDGLKEGGLTVASSLEAVCMIVRSLNPAATVLTATQGKLTPSQLLGLKAFDLKCQMIPAPLRQTDEARQKAQKSRTSVQCALGSPAGAEGGGAAGSSSGAQGTVGSDGVFHSSVFAVAHKSNVDTFTLVESNRPVDVDKFNAWLPEFLQAHGGGLYRLKGFLWVHNQKHKLVCQGVHMAFTGERGAAWAKGETKQSTLVFIGKAPLPRAEIKKAFDKCLK
jgi:G3E family GTPase